MIYSLYQIDFIESATGSATRLLDYGDRMNDQFNFPAESKSQQFAPIGAAWGRSQPMGGARRALEWSRRTEHFSHAEAAAYSISHPASLPYMRSGKIRVSIQDGESWDFLDAVLTACSAPKDNFGKFATITHYRAEAGRILPVSGVAHYSGIVHSWILTTHASQTRTHSAM